MSRTPWIAMSRLMERFCLTHSESECLCFKSRCTNVPSLNTERERISTSACHFWRPRRQRCRCLRCLLSIGERCSCMVQSLTYLGGQRQHVWRIKWRLESRHLIENASRGPNVCFLAVRLALDNFRTETNDEIYTLNADVKREKRPLLDRQCI